jgi:hypothetical protein
LGQETIDPVNPESITGEIRYGSGSIPPSSLGLKPIQLHFLNNVVMTIISIFNSFLSRSKFPSLVLTCAILAPLASFAQQYQETDQVSNAAGQGAKTVDPHLINPWVSLAAALAPGGLRTRTPMFQPSIMEKESQLMHKEHRSLWW